MDDADLDRTGRHAALGETTLERMVDWAHQHARLHLADVHRALHGHGQLQLRTVYGEVALGHCHPMLQQELALLSGADPFASQREAPERLAARIDGLDAAALGWRPAPGEWSVVEVLAHLVQTEIVYGYRYRATVAEPGGPLAGYDQEAWVARLSQPDLAAADLLEQLRALKAINVAFLERLAPEQRALWGLHGERGRESVAALIGAMAGHDVLHERQIEANIRAWRAREGG